MTRVRLHVEAMGEHVSSAEAELEVMACGDAGRVISTSCAATVAAWYQSSGTVGSVLAALASGRWVAREDLLGDIAATRRQVGNDAALEALECWAMSRPLIERKG